MNKPSSRLALIGLALGVLLALLLAPQTRWLVRLQMLMILHQYHPLPCGAFTTSPANDRRLYKAAVAHRSDDFLMQYGYATVEANDQAEQNLRALTRRYPTRPELPANILRYASRNILADRTNEYLLFTKPVPTGYSHFPVPSRVILAAYDREAATGERIDPDNAYFPLMRAYGLFAAHRDAEALAAVQRASVKPVWREYLGEDDEAHWKLHTAAFRDPGVLPMGAIGYSQLLWNYGRLRQTACLVTYQAVLKEQAGYSEEGLALREALRRCGDLMRVQSSLLIGSMIGASICTISQARPGGAPYQEGPVNLSPEQENQQRLEAYCAYVIKLGHPEAARRARGEAAARRIIEALNNLASLPEALNPSLHLALWWLADAAVLLNIVWLLILGLAAVWRVRRPAAEKASLGWKAIMTQIALVAVLWLLLAVFGIFIGDCIVVLVDHVKFDWRTFVGELGILGLILGLVAIALRRLSVQRRVSVFKLAGLLPVLVGLLYGLYWLTQWLAAPLAEIPAGLGLLTRFSGSIGSDEVQAKQAQMLHLCTAATLAIPLLLALGLSLTALVRRVAVSRALLSGFHRLAVPSACLLLVIYGGLILGTVRQEQLVRDLIRHFVYEGGRYSAVRAGQTWPGPIR